MQVKNKYEIQYDRYYHNPNDYNQVAAYCFDFQFSYKPDDSETCLANYDNPTICKVLKGEYCEAWQKYCGGLYG